MKKGRYVFYYRWGCGYVYVKNTVSGTVFFIAEYTDNELQSISIEDFKTMAKF